MCTPAEIVARYSQAGKKKTSAAPWKLFLLGVLGGVITGFGAALSNVGAHSLADPSLIRIVSGVLFAFGIGSVLVLGGELFTGNAMLIIPALDKEIRPAAMVRSFLFVYPGNFVGGLLVAAACFASGHLGMSDGALAAYTIKVAAAKCTLGFPGAIVSGVLCNLLICIGVLVSSAAGDVPGKIMGAFLPVATFVTCGFENAVANMYYIPAGLLAAARYGEAAAQSGADLAGLTPLRYFTANLLPVTIGNIAAGLAIGCVLWFCYRRPADSKAPQAQAAASRGDSAAAGSLFESTV